MKLIILCYSYFIREKWGEDCRMKLTNRKKKTLSFMIAALCAVSTGFAATDHWADASLTPQQVTRTIVGEDTDWQSWKDNWGQIRTNYEQVAIAPGTDATHLTMMNTYIMH